ncbi:MULTISPECIES: ABC transporter permease [unclassified Corynebacterium]|uniref:ABC transporter permease n=1 Tax=unclassified Corynebacterium TaxID=2624378 RepID=UPI001C43DF72|nr:MULTISPECIES: FtsX-like permease family protein [unclassified Corynebacterium]MBV7282391.1 FtsX-like permease family protein [Corynebacterium sp. TAE3-ERU30]MBV7302262.1 FtsX-like permease family protein [Corynebacterium sp. TAE3-ERU2]
MATPTMTPPRMRTISLRSVAAHKLRLLLTVLAVVLGTAFVAGSSMFTSTLSSSLNSALTTAFDDIDVVVAGTERSPQGIPFAEVDELRARPDVRAVSIQGRDSSVILTDPNGARIQSGAVPTQAIALVPPETLHGEDIPSQGTIVEGARPSAAGQIAINSNAAERGGISIGDHVTVLVPDTRLDAEVTGIYEAPSDQAGWLSIALREQDYRAHFTDGEHAQLAALTLQDPDAAESVQSELADALPNFMVSTGQHLVDQANERIESALSFVTYFLWAFAGIALLVSTFIISNTFAMLVAQRNREYALLRALGASATQITRSVVAESVVVGLVGSLLGVLAGVGLVRLITWLLNRSDAGLPDAGVSLTPTTIIAPVIVGLVVTVLSAWAPARKAGSIHPVQAMRPQPPTRASLKWRTLAGAAALLSGAVLCIVSVLIDTEALRIPLSLVGAGTLALVLGLWLAGPALSIPLVGGLGRILGAPFRTVGRLAATNSQRNPHRTAATAFSLTLGLIMVSSIGMLAASMQRSTEDIVDDSITADFVLTGERGAGISMPEDTAERVAALPEVDSISVVSAGPFMVNDVSMGNDFGPPTTPVADNSMLDSVKFTAVGGEIDLDAPGLILSETAADYVQVGLGEMARVSIRGQDSYVEVPVTALVDSSTLYGGVLSRASAAELIDQTGLVPQEIYVHAAAGFSPAQVRAALDKEVDRDLVTSVKDPDEVKGQAASEVRGMLSILYGLLALAVIVAILGIVNTLALSVIERRQEIGMLRAVGMQRRQVRIMFYLESAVIALYGAVVGAVVGIAVGCAFLENLKDTGLTAIVIPWGTVGIMLAGSMLVGVLAALWPAATAARTRPLEAITD